jgi:CheY-like chemotaxis protein
VSSSADALATWVPGRYAAVLADIHMPHEDGYELARRLRAAEAEHGATPTPIIAVTANAMKGEEERCLAAGMDAYLVKPVSFERLRGTLERWLAIQSDGSAGRPMASRKPVTAIDRNVLAACVNGCEDPRIDGVRRNGDEISTAVGSMLCGESVAWWDGRARTAVPWNSVLAEATGS